MFRFAPSPTGDIHIGNLRVAIFNYIVSQQRGEKLIIRIEDTDTDRNIEGKDREILEILNTFGIKYSDVIYQSHNLKFHHQFIVHLLQSGKAFHCFCSPDELEKKREEAKQRNRPYRYDGTCENLSNIEVLEADKPSVIRLRKPKEDIEFDDLIKGKKRFQPNDIDSFILLRQDKRPTYNFACAVDDMLSDISLVIRGEDHLSNTPKQIAIREALGYGKNIEYAHLPIILNSEGKKMSKRDNSSSVQWLLNEGFIPEAIGNYLILLGNRTPTEVFTIEEAIKWFKLENISKSPAKFDLDKLRFLNRKHLHRLDSEELSKRLGYFDKEIGELAKIYLEEASTLNELRTKIDAIFKVDRDCGEFCDEVEILKNGIREMDTIDDFGEFKKILMKKSKLKGKRFFKPLRILLTGSEHGPELSLLYPILKNYLGRIV